MIVSCLRPVGPVKTQKYALEKVVGAVVEGSAVAVSIVTDVFCTFEASGLGCYE